AGSRLTVRQTIRAISGSLAKAKAFMSTIKIKTTRRNGMDASHPVSAKGELPTASVTSWSSGTAGAPAPWITLRWWWIGSGPSRADGIKVPKVEEWKFFTGKPEGPT